MMFDFYLLKVSEDRLQDIKISMGSSPRRGYASICFLDCHERGKLQVEYFDLRGIDATERQFNNWVKREFGYLRTKVKFG